MKKFLACLTVLLTLGGGVMAQDTVFGFNPEALLFFHNNEFNGEKVNGGTLPGFVLRPKVVWQPDGHLRVEGGLNWLYYWGASRYPGGVTYDGLAMYADTAMSPVHLRPWLRAKVRLLPWLSMVLGDLENSGHGLPRPLYNRERELTADPEAGAQLLVTAGDFSADAWVDWRNFIWLGSPTQERLVSGVTARSSFGFGQWELYMPLHAVVQHKGGQSLTDTMAVCNTGNGSAGLGVGRRVGKARLSAEMHAMGYLRKMNYHHPWSKAEDTAPREFDKGWGLYGLVRAEWDLAKTCRGTSLLVECSFWRGEAFVPLLGSPHYSNVSANTPELTLDRMDVVTLHTAYTASQWSKLYSVRFAGVMYIYLPFSGDRPGYPKVERGVEMSYTLGAYIHINPTL